MSVAVEPVRADLPGRTKISARALQHLATALARQIARVDVRDVSVTLSDAAGALAVSVVVPVVSSQPPRTIPEQGDALRRGLIDGLGALAEREVRAVDIRFSGLRGSAGRRVV